MPKRESGFSHPFIILGVVAVAGLLLYFSANSNKNQQITQEIPAETQEQTKEEIENVPNPVNEFLQPKDISFLKDQNFTVYTGNIPPNIEGTYILNSQRSTFNSIEQDSGKIESYNMRIYDQKNNTASIEYSSLDSNDVSSGGGAFISGEGNCFTVFIETKGKSDSGCNYRVSGITSGCMMEVGIQNYQTADIMKYKDDKASCNEVEGGLMPVGNVRIIVEEDKLSEKK